MVVAAYGVAVWDGVHLRPGFTYWGDGESCTVSGCCLWSACGGMAAP